jgi:YD repeat-containing protein
MVSVVVGGGAGVGNTSRELVGGAGELGQAATGRAGERISVNGATGNLVIQNRDEFVVGVGDDISLLRTYNSSGAWDGDNADNWRIGYYRRVSGLTGTANTAGSTIKRIDADGFEATFTYDSASARYVSQDGAGAYDTLAFNAATRIWTWTDGDSGSSESYAEATANSNTFRLTRVTDTEGHSVRIGYDAAGLISTIATWKAGAASADETLTLSYDNATNKRLTQAVTTYKNDVGATLTRTRTRYEYDVAGRLEYVRTDLSPEDNSIADGKSYWVRYGYHANGRVNSITQTDGTSVSISYDASNRVSGWTNALGRTTTISYDSVNRRATVTDALGQATVMGYDGDNRLTGISGAALGGSAFSQTFEYTATGDLFLSANALNEQVVSGYDGNGNLAWRSDPINQGIARHYDGANLLTEDIVFARTDENGWADPLTTTYVYDTTGGRRRLSFVLSPEGRVTQYEYNSLGQRSSSATFTKNLVDVYPSFEALTAWAAGLSAADRAAAERRDYGYDLRGQLTTVTEYATASVSDSTVTYGTPSVQRYVHDAFGRLLQSIDATGNSTVMVYDGLDRLTLATDANTVSTAYLYDDAGNKTTVRLANGLSTVSTYNRAGLLVATDTVNGAQALGETRYFYDSVDRLRMTQDPTGARQWFVYDPAGRKVADVTALGRVTEYAYDAGGRLVQSIEYAATLSAAALATLVDASGNPIHRTVGEVRPAADAANDRIITRYYDAAGRMVGTQDALGYITETRYDGASRITGTTAYATATAVIRADTSTSSTLATAPALTRPVADAANDRVTRNLFSNDGLLLASLDAEGFLTEWEYDAAGRKVAQTSYFNATPTAERAAGTLATLRPAKHLQDRRSLTLYDNQGRVAAELDAEGYLTEFGYDLADRVLTSTRHRNTARLTVTVDAGNVVQHLATAGLTPTSLRPASGGGETTTRTYTALGKLDTETSAASVTTKYNYDGIGRLESTVRAFGSTEARTNGITFDAFGRVQTETGGPSGTVTHAYDAAGRRISTTDARGTTTAFFYDSANRLVFSIRKTAQGGEVVENRFNTFGETETRVAYSNRLSVADTTALTGGLVDGALATKVAALSNAAVDAKSIASFTRRGQIQQAIDALGKRADYDYTAFGQVKTSTADIGGTGDSRRLTTELIYDRRGLLTTSTADWLGLNIVNRSEYDAFGRTTATVDARGNRTTTQYLKNDGVTDSGRKIVVTDAGAPAGVRTTTYDAFDRTVHSTDALNNSVRYVHDVANRRVTMTTAEGIQSVTEFNRHGQTWRLTDGTGAITTYAYDATGRLLTVTDANGNLSQNAYDANGNLTTATIGLKVNGVNAPINDGSAVVTQYSYDAANRVLTKSTDPAGLNLTTRYEYDGQGRAVKLTGATGAVTTYSFNAKGELTRSVIDDVAGGLRLATAFTYHAQGRTLTVIEGQGSATAKTTEYRYDVLGRRTHEITDPAGLALTTTYSYDAVGNVVLKRDALNNATRYVYDALNRQQFVISSIGTITEFQYDAESRVVSKRAYFTALTGDITTLTDAQIRTAATGLVNAADQRMLYAYDKDGRQVFSVDSLGAATELVYDAAGRVVSRREYANVVVPLTTMSVAQVRSGLNADPIRDKVTRYIYDAAGRQIYSVDAAGGITELTYDAANRVTSRREYANAIGLGSEDSRTVVLSGVGARAYTSSFASIDTTKTYKVRVRLRQLAGNGTIYAGVVARDAAGNELYNSLGGNYPYAAAVAQTLTPEMGWVTYEGTITGEQVMNASSTNNKFFAGSKTAAPVLLYNYGGSGGTGLGPLVEVDALEMIDVATGQVINAGSQMQNGASGLAVTAGAVSTTSASTNAPNLTAAQVAQRIVADTARDKLTRYVYDAAGRQTFTIDAVGGVTELKYDAASRVTSRREYARPVGRNLVNLPYPSGVYTRPAPSEEAGLPAGDTVYETTNRDAFLTDWFEVKAGEQIDLYVEALRERIPSGPFAIGLAYSNDGVNYTAFDRAGLQKTGAEVGTTGGRLTVQAGASFRYARVWLQQDNAHGAGGRYFRNVEVTRADGSVPAQNLSLSATELLQRQLLKSDSDRITRDVYDAAGRRTFSVDALGTVSKYRYDAAGRLLETIRYANRIAATTAMTEAGVAGALTADAAFDRPSRYVYDAEGKLRFTVDALGGVVENIYDAAGRVARTIAYDTRISYASVSDASTAAAVRALLPSGTLAARETIYTYDAKGRLRHTARAQSTSGTSKLFTVAEQQYDALGRVTKRTEYSARVALQDLTGVVAADQLAARLLPLVSAASDRTTQYSYDAEGRVVQLTDGEAKTERYVYDALGRKTRFTNKNNAVFDYVYDGAGQLISEFSPTVAVTTLDGSLNATTANAPIETRYTYNGMGQLVRRIEAAGVAGQERTTRFDYDAQGQQVRTTFDVAGAYNAGADTLSNGIAGAAVTRTETIAAAYTQTVYNAFGEAIIGRDTMGRLSYKTYDRLGRMVNEVDANHNITQHAYSARDGEFTRLSRLATAATFSDSSGHVEAIIDTAVAAAGTTGARNVVSYANRLDQTTSVVDLADAVYSFDGASAAGGNWSRTTGYTYNAWGEVIQRSVNLDGAASRKADTFSVYDLQGKQTRQVDAEGCVTDLRYNAFGEVDQRIEYATKIAVPTDAAAAGSAAVTSVLATPTSTSAIGHDRIHSYAYDRRGLQVADTASNLQIGRRVGTNSAEFTTGELLTTTTYDGVGNVVSASSTMRGSNPGPWTIDGNTQYNLYDAAGRLQATTDADGRYTSFRRDALGNAVQITRWFNAGTVSAAPTAHANDQTTTQVFDKLGRVIQVRDATLNSRFMSYDAAGRMVKQWTPYKDADNVGLNNIQLFGYDAAGQQTSTKSLLQPATSPTAFTELTESATYNAFGEVTAKLTNGVQYAYYDYDNGGRVWRTNDQGGVAKVYLYDLQDNVTAVITSPTLDLKAAYSAPSVVPTTLAGGVRRTGQKYDKLGHLLEQSDLGATHLDLSTTFTNLRQTVDAWGNVLSTTSSRNQTTNFRYNHLSQIVEEKLPSTTYYSDYVEANGHVAVTARPLTINYLDAWGRQVATKDNRGKVNAFAFNKAGRVEYEYHADGGTVRHFYDLLGRETQRQSATSIGGQANGRNWYYEYDKLDRTTKETVGGRLLTHTAATNDAASTFVQLSMIHTLGTYVYDALGRRISDTSGADDKKSGATTKYYYDTAGRLFKTTNALGYSTSYQYDVAGRGTKETDALGQSATWIYLANGVLDKKIDIGGATTQFTYDNTGALKTQTNNRGQNLAYSYYDDGRLKTIRDYWADSQTTYDYDADGKKTIDRFATGASTATPYNYRNVTMTYDTLGRLASTVDAERGDATNNAYSLNIRYDAAGNRYRVSGNWRDNDTDENYDGAPSDHDTLTRRNVDITYTYDAMNRVTGNRRLAYNGNTTEGWLWETNQYDLDGNRIAEEKRYFNTGAAGAVTARRVEYSYDFANRVNEAFVITKTSNGAGADVTGARAAHRKVIYNATAGSAEEWTWAKTNVFDSFAYNSNVAPDRVVTNTTSFNGAGAATQVIGKLKIGNLGTTTGTYYNTSNQTYTYDVAGNLKLMHLDSYANQSNTIASYLDYKYTYLKMDGYLQHKATVSGTGTTTSVTTTLDYDVNGQLVQTTDTNTANGAGEQYLVNDNSGHVVFQLKYRAGAAMAAHMASGTYNPETNVHASTGGSAVPAKPALPSMNVYGSNQSLYVQRIRWANEQQVGTTSERTYTRSFYDPIDRITLWMLTQSYDTKFEDAWGGAPVEAEAAAGFQYTVKTGDTLRALAQTFYGDANLWYVLAEANALDGDATLVAGTVITVPAVTRSSNTSTTQKVYQPGEIIGDTNPEPIAPPPPPPPSAGGCGVLGTIIMIVVAVVVTYFTAGAAAPYFASLGAAAPVVTGAVAAAAGSVVSQGVGIAIGAQKGFSWKQVGLAALGGAVGGAVNGAGGLQSSFGTDGLAKGLLGVSNSFVATAVNAAATNAITQGLAVATGLQKNFDWRAVATSAIAAPAANYLGDKVGSAVQGMTDSASAGAFAQRLTAGVVSQRVRMAVYSKGKIDYASIAADAFGNALGDGIVDAMSTRTLQASQLAPAPRIDNPVLQTSGTLPLESFMLSADLPELASRAPMLDDRSLLNAAERASNPGAYTSVDGAGRVARDGDNISSLLGTSNPQAVGNFMRANSLSSSNIEAGRNYFMPQDARAYGNSAALGQVVINGDNARLAALAQERVVVGDGLDARDMRETFSYRSRMSAEMARLDAQTAYAERFAKMPGQYLEPVNVRAERAVALQRESLMNYLNGQGSMALGGVVAAGVLLGTGDITAASAATDVLVPLDNLIAPTGGGSPLRLGAATRRPVTREGIVGSLGQVVQPHLDTITQLDADALVGFRGSLARGFTGSHKGGGPFNSNDFDVDAFIVSDQLAGSFNSRVPFRSGAAIPQVGEVQQAIDSSLRQSPAFSGLRDEPFTFRIYTQQEIQRLQAREDAQYFFLKPKKQ